MRVSVLVSLIITVLLAGCLEIPAQETLSTNMGTRLVDRCPAQIPATRQQTGGLRSDFRITTWNLNKFQHANWQLDFKAVAEQSDLLLLQEAVERPTLTQLLQQSHFSWQQIQAFKLEGEAIGVLNAAAAPALYNCSLRELEPVSRLPKSALLTLYPLEKSSYPLLVINVHGINFELGIAAYRRQMGRLFALAKGYPGPVVLAGDFATWGNKRSHYLLNLAKQSDFSEAIPTPDLRVLLVSEPVDHIFYRKLQLNSAGSKATNTSDHNLIWADFSALKPPAK
jgi:endonuclease/exonuclease/phosphatase (EEP) superfamily protein YafD